MTASERYPSVTRLMLMPNDRLSNPNRNLSIILSHPATIAAIGLFWLTIAAMGSTLHVDEAMWGYQGWLWVHHGAPPYTGSVENKTPGIYMLFAVSELLFGHQYWFPRLIGIMVVVATSFILYRIARNWCSHVSSLMAMSVYLLASAWNSFDGAYASLTETFINFFTTLSFYWIISASSNTLDRPKRWMVAGFFVGCAIAFKQMAVLSATALFFFILYRQQEDTATEMKLLPVFFSLLAGIGLATAFSFIPLWASGVSFGDYFQGAWLMILHPGDIGNYQGNYVTWAVRLHNLPRILHRIDTYVLVGCVIILWMRRKTIESRHVPLIGLFLWMIADLLGAYASGKLYHHQLRQILPTLSLSIGLTINELFEVFQNRISGPQNLWRHGILWSIIVLMIGSPQMRGILEAWRVVTHPAPSQELRLGLWLKSHTKENEFVEVYGSALPGQTGNKLLYYSKRRSSSRYFDDYYIFDDASKSEVTEDLTIRHPPRFIALWDNKAPDWLWKVVTSSFRFCFKSGDFSIYENLK